MELNSFDVRLWRKKDKVFTNVPQSVVQHSPSGFEWGYAGSGPSELALNILNEFIPPRSDGLEPVKCTEGECSQTAWDLHILFKDEFLVTVPKSGTSIFGPVIEEWIRRNKKGI